MEDKEKIVNKILEKYNQEHIITWMNKVDENTKQAIINQVLNIDFEELKNLYDSTQKSREKKQYKIEPILAIKPDEITKEEKDKYIDIGRDILKKGKLAVVTLAGGQGTRLRT